MRELKYLILFFVLSQISVAFSGRVLFLVPITSKSELSVFRPLAVGLANKGHHVTYIASVPSPNITEMPPTWKEIIPLTTQVTDEDFVKGDLLDKRRYFKDKLAFLMNMDFSFADEICHTVYQNKEFQDLVLNKDKHFDVAVTSSFIHFCFEGIFWKKNIPFIYFSSLQVPQWTSLAVGFHQPPSYIPFPIFEYTDKMSFSERMGNALGIWWGGLSMDWFTNPAAEKIYRQYMGEDIPGLSVVQRQVSLIFSNSHYALTLPRPLPPDIIEMGGLHCRPGQKLPKDLDEFLSGAKDGFIYFSLGTVSLGKSMPEHVRKVFVKVFSKLKQRVLWKYETEQMPDLPKNVRLGKWLPQQDILAHPNIKLFITHGGLLSTQEASYHGTPLVGFPIGFDQDVNMALAENSGYAIKMEILEVTEEALEAAINKVLTNTKYIENARRISSIIKDQPTTPMDRGIYWTEHVMKYKGAPYLRSASRDLNFIQYHLLDVMLFLVAVVVSIIAIPILLIRKCWCGKKPTKISHQKKNK